MVLITGPGGSGKTTLAGALAERLGWDCIGEDDHWVAHGWSGLRTPAQEAEVQAEVVDRVRAAVAAGRGVVVELILYRPPPSPLTAYQQAFAAHGIAHATIALRPDVATIVDRLRTRGRPTDLADLDRRRWDAVHQLRCLDPEHLGPAWVIDPTAPVPTLVDEIVARFGS